LREICFSWNKKVHVPFQRYLLKTVYLKNTVAQSSVFSKSWSFSIIIENDHNPERTEDRATVFLKWTDFNLPGQFSLSGQISFALGSSKTNLSGNGLDWLCYLAGNSQTAPTIFFKFSGYVFLIISLRTHKPQLPSHFWPILFLL